MRYRPVPGATHEHQCQHWGDNVISRVDPHYCGAGGRWLSIALDPPASPDREPALVVDLHAVKRELHSVASGEDQNVRLEGDERGTRTMIRQILGAIQQQQKSEITFKMAAG